MKFLTLLVTLIVASQMALANEGENLYREWVDKMDYDAPIFGISRGAILERDSRVLKKILSKDNGALSADLRFLDCRGQEYLQKELHDYKSDIKISVDNKDSGHGLANAMNLMIRFEGSKDMTDEEKQRYADRLRIAMLHAKQDQLKKIKLYRTLKMWLRIDEVNELIDKNCQDVKPAYRSRRSRAARSAMGVE